MNKTLDRLYKETTDSINALYSLSCNLTEKKPKQKLRINRFTVEAQTAIFNLVAVLKNLEK